MSTDICDDCGCTLEWIGDAPQDDGETLCHYCEAYDLRAQLAAERDKYEELRDSLATVVDEACGMQPVLPADELLSLLENEVHLQHRVYENERARSIRTARALRGMTKRLRRPFGEGLIYRACAICGWTNGHEQECETGQALAQYTEEELADDKVRWVVRSDGDGSYFRAPSPSDARSWTPYVDEATEFDTLPAATWARNMCAKYLEHSCTVQQIGALS